MHQSTGMKARIPKPSLSVRSGNLGKQSQGVTSNWIFLINNAFARDLSSWYKSCFSLDDLKMFSFSLTFNILTIVYVGEDFFIFTLFGIQWVSLAQFSSVTQSCLTLCDPMDCTTPGLLVHHQFHSLLKLMSIMSVMPSNHLILCHPLSSCLQSFPASGSFQMSQLFASGGQNTGVSALTSVLPKNT